MGFTVDSLKVVILLPQPPECWGGRCMPPCSIYLISYCLTQSVLIARVLMSKQLESVLDWMCNGEKEVGPSEPQHEEGMAQILLAL